MSRQVRWLFGEVNEWVSKGLVSAEQAEQIRRSYPQPKPAIAWGTILFSGLGAAVAGLGIILLLAYNWQEMPKVAKLGVIFISIAAAHATGIWLFFKDDWRHQLGEALCLFGSMLFGAGIWLVAQVYHIDEHFPTGFLVWGLGTLLMAWVLPSLAQGYLATILLAIWSCNEALEFSSPVQWGPLLLLIGVGGLACWRRSRALLFAVLAGFAITFLSNAGALNDRLVFTAALNLSVLFVAVGILAEQYEAFPESRPIWSFYGWTGFLICLYLLTFPGLVDDLLALRKQSDESITAMAGAYRFVPFALAVGAWGLIGFTRVRSGRTATGDFPYETWFLPFATLISLIAGLAFPGLHNWVAAGIFNLILLALTAAWMARGSREGSLRYTVLGSVMLSALAFARYFDLFESLLVRGLVFLVVGAALFVEGICFRRAREAKAMGARE